MSTFSTCTSLTRPGSPNDGDVLFETDTKNVIIWDGTNWRGYQNDGANFGANTKSFEPDGTDDLLTVSNTSGVFTFGDGTNDSPFSMSTWVRTPSSPSGTRFITQADPTGTGIGMLFQINSGTSKFEIQIRDVNSPTIWIGIDSTVASGSTWYHVGCTYDGSKSYTGIKLYLNGNLETSTSNTSSGSYSAYNNGGYQLVIGGLLYNTNTNSYNPSDTLQDDVAIFNAELTASEMNAVYGGNYNTNKLISLYRAEDNTNDSFGSNNAVAPSGMGYSPTLHP